MNYMLFVLLIICTGNISITANIGMCVWVCAHTLISVGFESKDAYVLKTETGREKRHSNKKGIPIHWFISCEHYLLELGQADARSPETNLSLKKMAGTRLLEPSPVAFHSVLSRKLDLEEDLRVGLRNLNVKWEHFMWCPNHYTKHPSPVGSLYHRFQKIKWQSQAYWYHIRNTKVTMVIQL